MFKTIRDNTTQTLVYLLGIILISLLLKNIFISISIIVFLSFAFLKIKKGSFNLKSEFFFPIALYLTMLFSLLWSIDVKSSLFGLQKALPFLVVPLAFVLQSELKLSRQSLDKIFKAFSFSVVLFALFFLARAFLSFVKTKDTALFFYNNLVPIDPGAVYISVFCSFALFYFVQITSKSHLDKVALTILTVFLFLLSSKSIITIDFLIIVCYYAFFAPIPQSTKFITIVTVTVFLFFSILYVKEVKERFLVEYETSFVDNTLKSPIDTTNVVVHNVSIGQAWHNKKFKQNDFFPGAALRVYQTRIFAEILKKYPILLTGSGLEASQRYIREKTKEYNLYYEYGNLNFHNQYIQTFAELGIFGFLILLLMLFANIRNAFMNKDFLHIAFAITMIMLFLSESFFCRQRGIVFFIILYCLFNSLKSKKEL
ncbi:O-antigen ligase family protein [Flavobacterium sp. SM15]|uniref:O-antigen ligase family protein n=1 Tax=Flavobacterium sp. SM15 TaxID=2908005 RepID=UPI001ED9D358|nr:O-antigen ligase family protein [Flavobacterium sp. SM15]MCG2610362.1 O-antigen ligase family protein [Flavobacterium sp. SM15]